MEPIGQVHSIAMAAGKARATAVDLEALEAQGQERVEVIAGELAERASPSGDHAEAQLALGVLLRTAFHCASGGSERPGGWWILSEARIELEHHEVYVPDLVGWRRDRVAARPRATTIAIAPDWVCEVLSPSNAKRDLVDKLRAYRRAGIRHYWLVDPGAETLTVYRHREGEYVLALVAGRGDLVRAEPFDAIELAVGVLFGDEPST